MLTVVEVDAEPVKAAMVRLEKWSSRLSRLSRFDRDEEEIERF